METMPVAGPSVIGVEDLHRRRGSAVVLDAVTFAVGRGEVLGLVGPNGAGKSTLLEILSGLQPADGGRVSVLGLDPAVAYKQLAPRVGVHFQSTLFPPEVTVTEIIALYRSFYRGAPDPGPVIDALALGPCLPKFFRQLSAGQRQKLGLALALLHDPEILLLDEPTSALDPSARQGFWQLVLERAGRGAAVVLAGHQLDELERYASRVAVLDGGRLLTIGEPADLVRALPASDVVEFVTDWDIEPQTLDGTAPLNYVRSAGGWHTLYCGSARELLPVLLEAAGARSATLRQVQVRRPGLHDVFISLTGRRAA